ncbi:MAG: hypothetical protein K8S55_04580, partial [Phycisphaerae bacterium]|nr:hypothetical protein [Phycisphaerae bacterium]
MATEGVKRLEQLHLTKISNRIDEIGGYIWHNPIEIQDVAMAETKEHLPLSTAKKLNYKSVKGGQRWGQPWTTAWFRLRFTVPASFRGETVSLLFRPNGECIIFRDGKPVQGLDVNRKDYVLLDKARGGERIELYVEAGANDTFGEFEVRTMEAPKVAAFLPEVWEAWQDLRAVEGVVKSRQGEHWSTEILPGLPEDDTRRAKIIFDLNKAVDLFDYQDISAEALRKSARRVRRALKDIYVCRANASDQTIACMGHAHIDVAWLWPLAETVRKCGRTFSNVLEIMDRYPDFQFCQSQPHLYEFTRDRYPTLYKRIKEKIKKGQWIPTGCAWVEMDCNVTSGESLVRQVLFGTRFFRKEFNRETVCLWLPDVFGYSAALPQILKRSGIDNFLTQKISWSQFTTFPHHSFYWEGIDGTTVLSHFLPANDYNSDLDPARMLAAARRYSQKDRSPMHACLYGYGDGGGGPTKDMVERIRRFDDFEGMPKYKTMTPRDFFARLEAESTDLPVWVGELYLELHRGTLTTQARNKKFNRQCEFLLRETEALSAMNLPAGGRYRQKELNEAWKTVLLNQFHDIIPGSSIDQVYRDSDQQYAEVLDSVGTIQDAALADYAKKVDTRGEGLPVVAFNSLSWQRDDTVTAEVKGLRKGTNYVAGASDGSEIPVQVGSDGKARFNGQLPSFGHSVFHIRRGKADVAAVKATPRLLENDLLRVRFDKNGRLVSVFDKKAKREAIAPGATANQFILFEDKPAAWDAWDIDIFYNDKPLITDGKLLSAEVVEAGPVRSVVRFRRELSKSIIIQDVILTAGSARLDFATTIEWGDEKNVLLKVAFPLNVRSDNARYEIQFGNVERPTHWNTPQDFARFEVVGHKWA